jgi:putative addiction module killer protein
MPVEIVLNDISLPTPVKDKGTAICLMSELIGVLSTAWTYGIKTLRTQDNFYDLLLADNYRVASWLNDNRVEREEQSFMRRQLDIKTPLLADLATNIYDEDALSEFRCQGVVARAIGIAYLIDALAVSFLSDAKWDVDTLDIGIESLEEVSEELNVRTESIIHASRRDHILKHKPEIQNRLNSEPWHPKDDILPCYFNENGISPLSEWLDSLRDLPAKKAIYTRLQQVKRGSLGDWKVIEGYEGIKELRIHINAGYRIYFGQVSKDRYLLLYGGNKSTQEDDIKMASECWINSREIQKIRNSP